MSLVFVLVSFVDSANARARVKVERHAGKRGPRHCSTRTHPFSLFLFHIISSLDPFFFPFASHVKQTTATCMLSTCQKQQGVGALLRRTSLSFLSCTNSRRSVHREDVTLLQRGHRDSRPEADELAIDADRVDDVTAPFAAEKHSETFTPPYLQYITMASVASSLSVICSGKK